MLRTALEHEHILILNHHLRLDLAKTSGAEAAGQLIKKIIAIAHAAPRIVTISFVISLSGTVFIVTAAGNV